MKETIMVTGGAGFIGSHVCDWLISEGHDVVCVDDFNDYYSPQRKRTNISKHFKDKKFHLVESDIRDLGALEKAFFIYKPTKLIHLAARAGVRPSLTEPILYFDVNVNGTLNLLELSRKHSVKTIIFGSSSSVYGNNTKTPFSETDKTDSQISPYASSKKCGELLCKTYSELFGLNITCLRFFTVYGPRGRPDMAPFKFVDSIYNGRQIEMYGDGKTKRDYTYVSDIVSGIISALMKSERFEIINLGDSSPIELKEFVATIEKLLDKKAKIVHRPIPQGDVLVTYADISRAKQILGYNPSVKFEEGMRLFIEWYLSEASVHK